MSFPAFIPGAKAVSNSAGMALNKLEQKSEALHNAFLPVTVHDAGTDYDAPQTPVDKVVESFKEQIRKGSPFTIKLKAISALLDALRHSTAINDRKLLLEQAIIVLSRLPNNNFAQKLQNQAIELLYYDLPHPPATYADTKFQFRSADGSGNNVLMPDLGKANMPYSRSVQAIHPLAASELPDADLVYKSLLKRDKFEPHPGGLSSLMFGFATLVIHSIFRTSFTDHTINETSSYIDLAPLYGNDQAAQDAVRGEKDGRGKLHPDTFAEDRLLLLPPATGVILVLFNRNHNYIAEQLLRINERGWYQDPAKLTDESKRKAQDDEIFNTARLVNCMWFAQVVFSDYFSTILGLVRDGSSWSLNPFGEMRKPDHSMVERGRGNSVSIEFNILYRWHPTMSQSNVKWIEDEFKKMFKGKPFDKITKEDFAAAMRAQAKESKGPSTWNFGGMNRLADSKFKDEELASILKESTSESASAFKARGSPEAMQVIEVMGIKQAREWGACSLNDFRRFLQLKPYADFEEWSGKENKDIAEAARRLYGNIENLELYPGLQAEEHVPFGPGAGLCPPFTTSRAILSDAIALTRGDRFYTADLTPWNLTAWGYQDCQRDTKNAGFGSMLGPLLLRTLPNHYTYNSVYTWFALMTPEAMKTNLMKLKISEKYSFEEPSRTEHPQVADGFSSVSLILKDRTGFNAPYVERARELIPGQGYLLSLNDPATHKADWGLINAALAGDAQVVNKAAQFYLNITEELIRDRSYTLADVRSVDIVGDVLDLVPLHFVSTVLAGFPLKTKQNPHGTYMERELLQKLRDVFAYIFLEDEPEKRSHARETAKKHCEELLGHIKNRLKEFTPLGGLLHALIHLFQGNKDESPEFLKRLSVNKRPREELANDVFSVVLISSVEFSQALINVINLYLDDKDHRKNIETLAKTKGAAADAQLQAYAREALRLEPSFRGTYRHPQRDADTSEVKMDRDRPVYLNFADANRDPTVFSNPHQVDPSRSAEGYFSLRGAVFGTFSDEFAEKMVAQVLRAVFKLENVRREPGPRGTLRRVPSVINGTTHNQYLYLDFNHELSPWARSMILQYDSA